MTSNDGIVTEREGGNGSDFLHHVLESLNHPFYVIDADDYGLLMANSEAHKAFRSGAKKCYTFVHGVEELCDEDEETCPVRIVKKSKQPVTVEHVHYDQQGNIRNDEVHAYPIFDAKGNVAQILIYAIDITDRKLADTKLRQKTAEAKQRTEELKTLIHVVVHDLKTPAITISGLIRYLRSCTIDGCSRGRTEKLLEQISTASQKIESFLADFLNELVVENNESVKTHPVQLDHIVEEVVREHIDMISEKGIALRTGIPTSIPHIMGDEKQIRQALENLILNAVNYIGTTPDPEIIIEIEHRGDDIMTRVSDNGIGIAPELQAKIFERFFRAPEVEHQQGTGLGLHIVKKIIEHHGGRVGVESQKGNGSTFHFTLPIASNKCQGECDSPGPSDTL